MANYGPQNSPMRRDHSDRDKGRVKFRFIEFEMDAGDPTLQDTLRQITAAMGKGTASGARPVESTVSQVPSAQEKAALLNADGAFENNGQPTTESENSSTSARPTRRPSAPRSPKILDLPMKEAKEPLGDYIARKSPSDSDRDRYLAIAGWLKENLGLTEVTMDHIHTCYRLLEWQTPKDASSPFRNMKKEGWFSKGQGTGYYGLTHVGENRIMKMGKKE